MDVPGSIPKIILSLIGFIYCTCYPVLQPIFLYNCKKIHALGITKLYKIFGLSLKITIIILSFGSIYYQVFHRESINEIIQYVSQIIYKQEVITGFVIVFLLMIINWSIEALKWQFLLKKVETISFHKSFMGVLYGLTISIFMPNRTGEFAGRIMVLEKRSRWKGVFLTIVGSISQFIVTLIIGTFGALLLYLLGVHWGIRIEHVAPYYFIAAFLSIILTTYFYFHIAKLEQLPIKRTWFTKLKKHIHALALFRKKELGMVILMSFFRYMVFSFQFYLLLLFCGIDIPFYPAVLIIATWFLFITIIPTVALSEIGVRGAVSVFLFHLYFEQTHQIFLLQDEIAVLTAAFALWAINIIIPALLGALLSFRIKIFNQGYE